MTVRSAFPVFIVVLVGTLGCGGSRDSDASSLSGPSEPEAPAVCTVGSGPFPRSLELPNPEPNGVFDPNLARDPETGRLWMAYSGVSGPAGSGLVSTHLAYSDDDGTTWCHAGVVNQARDVPREEQPARVAGSNGHWNHEVAAIVNDPAAPAQARWRLVWHRYLHVADSDPATDDRRFEYGWIAQRTAASAEALLTAPETKLFAAAAYSALPEVEAYNDAVTGGRPLWRLDRDPDLAGCLAVTEPGVIASGGAFYVAMFCFRAAEDQDIVLVRLTHGTGEWAYVGTLLTTRDAAAINPALVGFNAADIVTVGGTHRLLVLALRRGGLPRVHRIPGGPGSGSAPRRRWRRPGSPLRLPEERGPGCLPDRRVHLRRRESARPDRGRHLSQRSPVPVDRDRGVALGARDATPEFESSHGPG